MGISGRYEAHGQNPRHNREVLHLRVDVDRIAGRGPVMNWISGDVFERNELDPNRGKHVFSWRIKVPPRETGEDGPRVVPFTFGGTATRLASGSAGSPLPVSVHIREDAGHTDLACTVTVTMPDGIHTFEGQRHGPEFRTLELGLAFCTDTFRNPDCELNPSGPAATVRRLSLDAAFAEAGVALKQPTPPIAVTDISDSDKKEGWTTSELHASLEAQLVSRELNKDSDWPRWFLCGLLADRHASGDLGVMFDEKEPNRQGFAVFQTHNGGPQLPRPDVPLGAGHAEALRLYFFTWVHEMGHAFNLLHSNQKARSGALSWMNHHGALKNRSDFWNKFTFSFDEEEIVHIRHGNWEEVVMGGLPLGRGGHLRESPSVLDCSPAILDASAPPPPLQLVLSDGGYFDLMRPVTIHVELRNQSGKPLPVDTDLSPEGGHLAVLVRRPDGRTIEYVPPVRVFRKNDEKTLQPNESHGQLLHLTYGRDGFYFDDPGQYVLRAVYLGDGTNFIMSNRLHLRVGFPPTAAHDRLAQEFFSPDIGRCLYFGGSASPYLGDALAWLTQFATDELARSDSHDGRQSWLGADIARVIADGIGTPFRYMAADGKVKSVDGRPVEAAALTQAALRVYGATGALLNSRYRQLIDKHEAWTAAVIGKIGAVTDAAKKMGL